MKTLGVIGGVLVFVALMGGGFPLIGLAGGMVGLMGGMFGMMVGLAAGLLGGFVGILAGVFGLAVGLAAVFATVVLPVLVVVGLILGIVKLFALA
jgi:hypothetical protein